MSLTEAAARGRALDELVRGRVVGEAEADQPLIEALGPALPVARRREVGRGHVARQQQHHRRLVQLAKQARRRKQRAARGGHLVRVRRSGMVRGSGRPSTMVRGRCRPGTMVRGRLRRGVRTRSVMRSVGTEGFVAASARSTWLGVGVGLGCG